MSRLVEIDPNLTLDQVAPIYQSSVWVLERESMSQVAELPVLNACLVFYDKNINTVVSSANVNHRSGYPAYITLDYGRLSEENKEVAREVCEVTFSARRELAGIIIPIPPDLKVLAISKAALVVAEKFKLQSNAWTGETLEEVRKSWGLRIGQPGAGAKLTPEDLVGKGYFYDPEIGLFFMSEEHLKKEQAFRRGEVFL